jgi:divalent metal cation (Fe/Co/Zn/Cd) transporter
MARPIQRGSRLRRRGLRLVYATTAWNALEGTAAIVAGVAAHSVALTAFGLDSSVEVFVSAVAAWQLLGRGDRGDKVALRIIGACFVLVGIYIAVESVLKLMSASRPEATAVGVALTASAVVVMTVLGGAKRSVGRQLGNRVLEAEARFSLVDAALSGTVLIGLVLNLALGWWWADPAVALVLAAVALREGIEGLTERAPT